MPSDNISCGSNHIFTDGCQMHFQVCLCMQISLWFTVGCTLSCMLLYLYLSSVFDSILGVKLNIGLTLLNFITLYHCLWSSLTIIVYYYITKQLLLFNNTLSFHTWSFIINIKAIHQQYLLLSNPPNIVCVCVCVCVCVFVQMSK